MSTSLGAGMGIPRSEVERVLESVGFVGLMRDASIASLSGGWKMKLALGALPVSPFSSCCSNTVTAGSCSASSMPLLQTELELRSSPFGRQLDCGFAIALHCLPL